MHESSHTADLLTTKPWVARGQVTDTSIFDPRGMVGPEERACYFWLAKNCLSGDGCIVDAGAFLGASTYCFAAGAAAAGIASYNGRPVISAFDYFKVVDQYVADAICRDVRPIRLGESYLAIFQSQTDRFNELIRPYPGNFLDHTWEGDAIKILFVDISKSEELNSHVVREFFPALIPGKSLVIQQDYYHCWHPHIHVTMEFLSAECRLIDDHVPFQSAVWQLVSPIPRAKLDRLIAYDFTNSEKIELLDRVIKKSSPRLQPMMELVRIWQMRLNGDLDRANSELLAFREAHDCGAGELWATQSREVHDAIGGLS